MEDRNWLAERFEAHRPHLRAVAYRLLGSASDAEDAVQETWLRAGRAGASNVVNLGGWLTTIVARVCLNMLRARAARRETSLAAVDGAAAWTSTPDVEAAEADSVGVALLVVLDMLSPPERVAFVLHDLFSLPYEDIAPIVDRSPAAARQLGSRARRRVRGARPARLPAADLQRHRAVLDAFLAASREGDLAALLQLLAPDVVMRTDGAAGPSGVPMEVTGAARVAKGALAYSSRSRFSGLALVDGDVGIVVAPGGRLFGVLRVTVRDDRIVAIDLIADTARLDQLELAVLEA